MLFNRENGTVRFPNGLTIGSALTQEAFLASPASRNARSQDYGTLPWIHYHLSGGQLEGRELLVSLCFFDQILVHLSVTANFYPSGLKDWSNYSLDVEATTKQFHDRLLEQMLSKPSKGGTFIFRRLPDRQHTLERPLCWRLPWGTVSSFHDPKGGGTYIGVSYGNRRKEAQSAWRRLRCWAGHAARPRST
jgi:hypothetical protein